MVSLVHVLYGPVLGDSPRAWQLYDVLQYNSIKIYAHNQTQANKTTTSTLQLLLTGN